VRARRGVDAGASLGAIFRATALIGRPRLCHRGRWSARAAVPIGAMYGGVAIGAHAVSVHMCRGAPFVAHLRRREAAGVLHPEPTRRASPGAITFRLALFVVASCAWQCERDGVGYPASGTGTPQRGSAVIHTVVRRSRVGFRDFNVTCSRGRPASTGSGGTLAVAVQCWLASRHASWGVVFSPYAHAHSPRACSH